MASKFVNPYIDKIKAFNGLVYVDDQTLKGLGSFRAPYNVDIGCGNGEDLVRRAQADPLSTFIGVELQYKEVYRAALKIQKAGLKNCCVFKLDAKKIPVIFKDRTLASVNLLFPDPWPKTKQKKNRLFNRTFLKDITGKMLQGAEFRIRTDNDDYFVSMVSTLYALKSEMGLEVTEFSRDFYRYKRNYLKSVTAFERIFLKQGLLINAMYFKCSK